MTRGPNSINMDKIEIKRTWKRLLIPCITGVVILLAGIAWNRLGGKRPDVQLLSFFVALFGAMLSVSAALKIVAFRKFLRNKESFNESKQV